MKILVSGAGIAGPCLAYWLARHGFSPTLVERAPRLRTGGYIIDFWGVGFDVAERMGLIPELLRKGYHVNEVRQVNRRGKRVSGFSTGVFDRMTRGRFTSLPRSELAASLYGALGGRVETLFANAVTALKEQSNSVRVSFEKGPAREFDLVVGADGLHSEIRRLAFGEEAHFERYLGLKAAAFSTAGYRPRDELSYVIHSELGQQVGRFAMRDDLSMFLFVFADADPDVPRDLAEAQALLRRHFARSGWESARILDALPEAGSLYLDRVSQIRMERWTLGRVALVGDAAYCISLLGGQGSALAMVGAYVLAGELKRAGGDHEVAFARYQKRLAPFIEEKQRAAVRLSSFFAPRSRLSIFVRNQVMKLLSVPFVSDFTIGRELRDNIELPEY